MSERPCPPPKRACLFSCSVAEGGPCPDGGLSMRESPGLFMDCRPEQANPCGVRNFGRYFQKQCVNGRNSSNRMVCVVPAQGALPCYRPTRIIRGSENREKTHPTPIGMPRPIDCTAWSCMPEREYRDDYEADGKCTWAVPMWPGCRPSRNPRDFQNSLRAGGL